MENELLPKEVVFIQELDVLLNGSITAVVCGSENGFESESSTNQLHHY